MTLWDDDGRRWHCASSEPQLFLIFISDCDYLKISSLYATWYILNLFSWTWNVITIQTIAFHLKERFFRQLIHPHHLVSDESARFVQNNNVLIWQLYTPPYYISNVRSKIFCVIKCFTFHNWLHHQLCTSYNFYPCIPISTT